MRHVCGVIQACISEHMHVRVCVCDVCRCVCLDQFWLLLLSVMKYLEVVIIVLQFLLAKDFYIGSLSSLTHFFH